MSARYAAAQLVAVRGRASLVAVMTTVRAYWRFIEAPGGAAMKR
ncbi:hypothetical protein ACPXCG_01280 [Gordonia sp. DT218]